jgi:membrane protein DedA with SNARE-associated domain
MVERALLAWIVRHGYVGLFSLLVLGIVGLPVPDEVVLTYAGALAHAGSLTLHAVLLVAFCGSASGITLSYWLGRAPGARLVGWLGPRLGLTPARLTRAQRWFEHWGRWTLVVGYFVPGIRHLTAIVAGTSGLRFRSFAVFAYPGASFGRRRSCCSAISWATSGAWWERPSTGTRSERRCCLGSAWACTWVRASCTDGSRSSLAEPADPARPSHLTDDAPSS